MEIPVTIGARRVYRWLIPAALLIGLIPFYWAGFSSSAVGLYHDDGIYLVTAKSLAEGQGYRILSLPDAPRQTKYPFGFPVLLALMWRAFPNFPANIPALKMVPLVALLAWLGMAAVFARRWGKLSAPATLWLVFICAGTSRAVFVGTNLMSDLLFGALVLGALHFLLKVPGSRGPAKTALAAAVFCAAGYFVRSAGVAVIAGGFLGLLAARRFRPALVFGAVSALALAIWVTWQRSAPVPADAIQRYYTSANYTDWNLITGDYSLAERWRIFLVNTLGAFFYPLKVLVSNRAPVIFGIAGGWLGWTAYGRGLFRSPELRPANLSFAIYLALLLLYAWNAPDRFLLPFLPLLLTVGYIGLPQRLRLLPFALAAAAGIFFALAVAAHEEASEAHVPWGVHGSNAVRMEQWIQNNTEPDSVIVANYDPAIYLYTGRKSIRAFVFDNWGMFYGTPRSLAIKDRNLREVIDRVRPRFIVRTGGDGDEPDFQRLVDNLVRDGTATEVHRISEDYAVYQISAETRPLAQPGFPESNRP